MHWQLGVVIIFWFNFAASTAALCDIQFCGSQSVSYPFWIDNPDCGYPGFQIICKEKQKGNNSMGLFFGASVNGRQTEFDILSIDYASVNGIIGHADIDYSGHLYINSTDLKAMSCEGDNDVLSHKQFELPANGPFTTADTNKFVVVGCRSKGSFRVEKGGNVSCTTTTCIEQYDSIYCNGYGCCEAGIPDNQRGINFTGGGIRYENTSNCGFSTILDPVTWDLPPGQSGYIGGGHYGLRLQWAIGQGNCLTTSSYSCAQDAQCLNTTAGGHVCKCPPGYEGTGYSNGTGCTDVDECSQHLDQCVAPSQGGVCTDVPGSYNCSCAKGYYGDGYSNGTACTDVDECMSPHLNHCVAPPRGVCINVAGSYYCSCAMGYYGDGNQNGTKCQSLDSKKLAIPAIIGSISSVVVIGVVASIIVWWLKKRHLRVVEAKYYQHLQQYITSKGGRESLKMFSADELAKASNNYSKEMVLGSGGFGTVYKGILLDGTLAAIKKSKKSLNLKDDHEFLNEVAILSQINHRNIVKILGCCIQTKFPMLVSEFIPNGTLYEHLQFREVSLPWATRLHIAIKIGEALAYLHSGASQPIFHRDVKSSNILLDQTFSPKIADFGISRLISAPNDTHHTTDIMGTRGYLDPEYFQTYQLTDKSDVFSFGVVLVELLTGLKPLSVERRSEEWNLSTLFLARLDDGRLKEILDSKVLKEENLEQMEDVGRLAKLCLHMQRRKRPSMKEVVEELVWIRGGTRKTNFHDSEDEIFQQTNFSENHLKCQVNSGVMIFHPHGGVHWRSHPVQ